jgi:branched-chain amino acid transport system ATP-binding protein
VTVALLEVRDLHAGYGKLEILKGVSLDVQPGQVVSIIGPNGAGKSTVFKTLFGLLPARQGRVTLDGEDVTNQSPAHLLRRGMAYVPQGRNVFPLMTVEENLRLGAYTRPRSAELETEIERLYETFPVLRESRRRRAGDLSGGQQQMLEMARALLLKPRLILLDEPTLGLAPLVFKEIFRIVESLRRLGQTILMVEQNAAKALEISDYAYVLELGQNRYEGAGDVIRNDERVRRLYLGRERARQGARRAAIRKRPAPSGVSTTSSPGAGWIPVSGWTTEP